MDTTATIPGYPAARLCAKCSVLEFDDRQLKEDENDESELERYPVSRAYCKKELKLDYLHMDVLPELPGLRQSAEAGCDFCAYLREAIRSSHMSGRLSPRLPRTFCIRLSYYSGSTYAKQYGLNALVAKLCFPSRTRLDETLTVYWRSKDEEGQLWDTGNHLIFKVEPGRGNCKDWLSLEPAPRAEALCTGNIKAVRSLLDACLQKCHHPQDSWFTPTRLLDLCAPGRKDGICLIDTQSMLSTDNLRYAALSYCWGGEEDSARQSITTTSNLSSRLADIRFSSLSRVIQDAVEATRSLEIRYLWIDSACIIQDDSRDWERESEKMGLVYTNAYVTIVALASSSCHESFFARTDPLPIKFDSSMEVSVRGTYCLRFVRCADRGLWLRDSGGIDLHYSAWRERAWTLQEERLSTRLLFFGASRMTLTCANLRSVEPFEDTSLDSAPEPILDKTFEGQFIPHSQRWRVYESWLEIMNILYTGRHITDARDIFPAVSGIAKRVATATSDVYVAGLWKDYLPRGLDWIRIAPMAVGIEDLMNGDERSPFYICPSWSWAAAKYGTKLSLAGEPPSYNYRTECEIVSAWSDLVSDLNPFGRITFAELQIKGREIGLPSDIYHHKQRDSGLREWRVNMNEHHTATCFLDWDPLENTIPLQGKLSMLLLSSYREYDFVSSQDDLSDANNRTALGLLLHPAKIDGKYIRVGLFQSEIHQGGLQAFQDYKYREMHII